MRSSRIPLLFFGALLALASPPMAWAKRHPLELLGVQVIPTKTLFQETELGGISGLAYDDKNNQLIAVSDDRSEKNPARLYVFDINVESSKGKVTKAQVTPQKVIFLKNSQGADYGRGHIDAESIARLPNGELIIGSEGDLLSTPPVLPGVWRMSADGKYLGDVDLPEAFIHDKPTNRGPYPNNVYEAMTTIPNGHYLFIAPENALQQDGERADSRIGGPLRLLKMHEEKGVYRPVAQYVYPLEPIPTQVEPAKLEGETGLVELIALSTRELLALERSYIKNTNSNSIRLYRVGFPKKSSDVSKLPSLRGEQYTPVEKTLLMDLDDVVAKFPEGEKRLDNFEAMAMGPKLPGGGRLLIMASDNNFNPGQRTLFAFFRYQ